MSCKGCGGNQPTIIPRGLPQGPTGETTQCQCNFPDGQNTIFCDRHKCTKTKPLYHLCKYREDYYQLWESGHGPMQTVSKYQVEEERPTPKPEKPKKTTGFFKDENEASKAQGLGDTIAKLTEATGIKTVVDAVSEATGRDCGCRQRQNKLNDMFPYKQKKTKGFFQ